MFNPDIKYKAANWLEKVRLDNKTKILIKFPNVSNL